MVAGIKPRITKTTEAPKSFLKGEVHFDFCSLEVLPSRSGFVELPDSMLPSSETCDDFGPTDIFF